MQAAYMRNKTTIDDGWKLIPEKDIFAYKITENLIS